MRILVVKNPTEYINNVLRALSGHEVELLEYRPGVEFDTTGKDLVILSGGGGDGFEIYDKHENGDLWYRDELDFIPRCDKPLLGICMGFELIAHAFGSEIIPLARQLKGFKVLNMKNGRIIRQFEYREFGVREISDEFEVLAESVHGIEMIRHRHRPIFATQFHPEVDGGTLSLEEIVSKVLIAQRNAIFA